MTTVHMWNDVDGFFVTQFLAHISIQEIFASFVSTYYYCVVIIIFFIQNYPVNLICTNWTWSTERSVGGHEDGVKIRSKQVWKVMRRFFFITHDTWRHTNAWLPYRKYFSESRIRETNKVRINIYAVELSIVASHSYVFGKQIPFAIVDNLEIKSDWNAQKPFVGIFTRYFASSRWECIDAMNFDVYKIAYFARNWKPQKKTCFFDI